METDVSGVGLGVVLSQEVKDGTLHPVAYASRTLQLQEQNYGATELEALHMVWVVKHFRHCMNTSVLFSLITNILNTPCPSGKLGINLTRHGLKNQV